MRLLDNTIKLAGGGGVTLTFTSDFAMPTLARPN